MNGILEISWFVHIFLQNQHIVPIVCDLLRSYLDFKRQFRFFPMLLPKPCSGHFNVFAMRLYSTDLLSHFLSQSDIIKFLHLLLLLFRFEKREFKWKLYKVTYRNKWTDFLVIIVIICCVKMLFVVAHIMHTIL